jgi:hypothetical protein
VHDPPQECDKREAKNPARYVQYAWCPQGERQNNGMKQPIKLPKLMPEPINSGFSFEPAHKPTVCRLLAKEGVTVPPGTQNAWTDAGGQHVASGGICGRICTKAARAMACK